MLDGIGSAGSNSGAANIGGIISGNGKNGKSIPARTSIQ